MMLQPVPVVGGCYADDTKPYSAQDCVNWIPERAEVAGGRSNERLLNPPGMRIFSAGFNIIPQSGDFLINELGEVLITESGKSLTA